MYLLQVVEEVTETEVFGSSTAQTTLEGTSYQRNPITHLTFKLAWTARKTMGISLARLWLLLMSPEQLL